MSKKYLIAGIIFLFLVLLVISIRMSYGQEVSVNIGVVEGSLSEKTTFNSLSTIDGNIYKDSYRSNFRVPGANLSFNKMFGSSGVITNITGVASTGYITSKEIISTEQVYGNACCGAAAGSKFTGTGIEYKGEASPGGIGACCGVNFTADVPQSIGRLEAASIYMTIGEIAPAEEGGIPVFVDEFHKTEVMLNGNQNDFLFNVVSPVCPPAEGPPGEPFFKFELCTKGGLTPWPE